MNSSLFAACFNRRADESCRRAGAFTRRSAPLAVFFFLADAHVFVLDVGFFSVHSFSLFR